MISDRAKSGIDRIFLRAARSRLVLNPGDRCEILDAPAPGMHGGGNEDFVVLTISSIGFRLLTLIHIDDDEPTRAYYGRGSSAIPFQEMFFEVANLCCGAMNQELVRYFPDLGMSTPYRLDGRCAAYLAELKPGYVARHAIAINDNVRMTATLCVCANQALDFAAEADAPAEAAGELELF